MKQSLFLLFILPMLCFGQVTIFVTTNNYNDLNPERDALSAPSGDIRIRNTVTDGVDPIDISSGLPIPLRLISREDGYTNNIINTITNDGVGVIWWVLNDVSAGEYRLQSDVTLPGDGYPIYDRYLSVTSAPSAAAQVTANITNVVQYTGSFTQTIITNLIDQFVGVNVFTPIEVETNATDTWTISLTTNYAVGTYLQTGNITSVVFSVDSTNDVALGEVLLQATTNTISWPTNGLTWAAGAAPTLTTGQWSILYFRAWRDDVHAVYVGDSP